MTKNIVTGILVSLALVFYLWGDAGAFGNDSSQPGNAFTGAQSCRECHERFYQLWAPSHHGKAMQPYSDGFARKNLTAQPVELAIGEHSYLAQTSAGQGWVLEKGQGGEKKLPIKHALGGKNVYYFLTPMDKGRLQTLPLAYDLHQKKWFDTAKSGVRHAGDAPVNWKNSAYTFNTACHSCHVSQFSLNYDLKTGDYHTTWKEPGINCETCHGPAQEHIEVCKAAPKGTVPKDLKITRGGRDFSAAQNNAVCASCHAKMIPLTTSFKPGEKFFDHFDLAAFEHPDYYPDGRDLGENYSFTSWRMSPCLKSGKLDCLDCHTSSGRFRQKKDPNRACLPCHKQRVAGAQAHTMHKPVKGSPTCISCHMPQTGFARMKRSDHSMLPPAPALTIKYGSPNACNLCHKDKDAAWADKQVRKWRKRDYQKPVLLRAGLIDAARKRDWSRAPEMLAYLESQAHGEITTAGLIRLMRSCPDEAKWPVLMELIKDASPLVRSAAVEALGDLKLPAVGRALAGSLSDDSRLVRIRAAQALAFYPSTRLPPKEAASLRRATAELEGSLLARPDMWSSHYNAGNFLMEQNRLPEALASYKTALTLEPRAVMALVNASMAHARMKNVAKSEEYLKRALKIDPKSAAAHFNLGLFYAEQAKKELALKHLEEALEADPKMAAAAYNLGMLLLEIEPTKGLELMQRAYELHPNPRYAGSLAYFLGEAGQKIEAVRVLRPAMARWPGYGDGYLLLSDLYLELGEPEKARGLLEKALNQPTLPQHDLGRIQAKLRSL